MKFASLRQIFQYVSTSYPKVLIESLSNSFDRITFAYAASLDVVASYQQSKQFQSALNLVRRSASQVIYRYQLEELKEKAPGNRNKVGEFCLCSMYMWNGNK